jgi:hypothetical protein
VTTAEATRIIARLKNAWPHTPMTPGTAQEYGSAIIEYDAADADEGVTRLERNEDRWPAIATLRRYISDAMVERLRANPLPALPEADDTISDEQREWARQELERRGGLRLVKGATP